jgi:cytochrome c peroxidase
MMRASSTGWLLGGGAVVWAATTVLMATAAPRHPTLPNMLAFPDASGHFRTYSASGAIDLGNPFFQSLGTNGRSCSTCHQPSDAWSVTPEHIQARFDDTGGLDPIFRTNDGSVSPLADISSVTARRAAFRMLLSKGLIRVGIGVSDAAEFRLIAVDDPYGFASATELSLFRRPLPATNLGFLATVMWDGRETFSGESIHFDLSDQANGATLGHAAGAQPLTDAQREAIVDFETALFTAQTDDSDAGDLHAVGATGGPTPLASQGLSLVIYVVLGKNFNPRVFTLFDAWSNVGGPAVKPVAPRHLPLVGVRDPVSAPAGDTRYDAARRSIARGEAIFNTRPIAITGVRGLNDVLDEPTIPGTCTTCHNTPNAGNHSTSLPLDLGLTGVDRRTPDMPLYTFQNKQTGEIVRTTDPGRALLTGRWKDMSLFKGPILRGLAARPPYFHNGSAATLEDVVDFYDTRFGLQLTPQEKADLVAFLKAL